MGSETHAFPPKPSKKKDDEDFERFAEMIRPIFLRMRLTDMLKMNLYTKYMKEIVTVGWLVRHMSRDGLSLWEPIKRRRCLETG